MSFVSAFYQSTIGKKVIMAVTGLLLVGFVIGHMLGHLQMFESAAKYDAYAHFLQSLGGLLWLVRLVLFAAVVLHVVMAVQLTRRSRAARPVPYVRQSPQVSTLASRSMRVGGFLVLAFVIFHILHFTTLSIFPEYRNIDVYSRMIVAFHNPWLTAFYVISMVALGLHLYHGAWSSFRTLGLTRPSANPLSRKVAVVVAVVVAAGFIVVPVAIAAGVIKSEPAATPSADTRAAAAAPER
jgi:succinate dehydrogenase / fumarate reductase cytochrome b subunit